MKDLVSAATDSQMQSAPDKAKTIDELNSNSSKSDLGMTKYSNTESTSANTTP